MNPRPAIALLALAALIAGACTERDDMRQGARLKPFERPHDGSGVTATDLPPPGTIPRDGGLFQPVSRPATTLALLQRGRVCFDAYCSPCHARDGYSDGAVVRHGFPRPPSLHDAQIRAKSDDHYMQVLTNGLGKMPPYGPLVRPADRWAVVAYVRALQLSQHADPAAVPPGTPIADPDPEPAP